MSRVEPLLKTKLFIPYSRQDVIPRPHLTKRLNDGLRGGLTLVTAPAGFGKTTLVSTWISEQESPVAWLSLDENDNDLNRFLTYLVAALRNISNGIGIGVLTVLQSSQKPQTEVLLTILVNEIATIERPFILVLDDCHLINDQPVNEALEFLIYHLPANLHLVLIGRVELPIPFSRLRVGGQLTEIRSDDLRFSLEETTNLLNKRMTLDLTNEDIRALETRTEGWIAGLQLAALSLQGRSDKHEFVKAFSGTHIHIIDYLVEEVLSRQSDEIRSFLCRTSILGQMCAPLCDAILGLSNSRQILRELQEAELFLIPLDLDMHWFRYHHLFADFLRLCLEDEQIDQIANLHCRAAEWYEANGYVDDALDHFLAAEAYTEAARLVEGHGRDLLEQSQLATLMKWVEKIPDEYVCKRPWLCVYHAWALRLSGAKFQIVESQIIDARKALEKQGLLTLQTDFDEQAEISVEESHRLMGHIIALRAFQALYTERIPQVIKLAEQAKTYNPEEGFVRSSIGFALGWAYRFSGDLVASHQAFDETTSVSIKTGNIYMAVAAKCRNGYGKVLSGQLHQAAEHLREAENLSTSTDGLHLPVVGYAYVYLAGVLFEWNDLDRAMQYAVDGIEQCEQVGYIMDQIVGYVYLVRVRLAMGDWDGAQEACKNAKQLSQMMKDYVYALRWVEDCEVRLWVAQGDLDALSRWVQECGLNVDDDLTFMRDIDYIILARALLALANSHSSYSLIDTETLLKRMQVMAETAGWNGKLIEILVLQALLFHKKGDEEGALNSLAEALTLAKPEGNIRTFIDEGQPMAELLRVGESRGIETHYIHLLLDALDPVRKINHPGPVKPLIEQLSERELEVLKMLATDLSGPEIARELSIALSTVRYHTNNIYGKLSVNNRRAAVRMADKLNIL
jgi:LuxR family maltose regulon positive regulatory protein